MLHDNTPSPLALPIELVYCVLDQLKPIEILLSVRNVCQRLDTITDTYHPYQVNFRFDFSLSSRHLRTIFWNKNQVRVAFAVSIHIMPCVCVLKELTMIIPRIWRTQSTLFIFQRSTFLNFRHRYSNVLMPLLVNYERNSLLTFSFVHYY